MTESLDDARSETASRGWDQLSEEEQTRLQIAYGHYLDGLPPTCSLETKIERFRRWLVDQGIVYQG